MTSQQEHPRTATTWGYPGASRRWRVGSSLAPGMIAFAVAVAFVLARLAISARHNIGNFILVGHQFTVAYQVPPGIPVRPGSGYDGQFFYRLALDPANLSRLAYGIRMDQQYRYMRIGYPALTWLLSAGQHSLVPAMLVAVNVLAVGAMGYLGGIFARQGGRSALWGLLLPAYFGMVMSVSRDTAEPLAAAFLLAGLLAMRAHRPVLAGVLLAYGVLTRETVMVAAGSLTIVRVMGLIRARRTPGRDDLAWVLPGAAFAVWQALVYSVTGSLALAADGTWAVANGNWSKLVPFAAPLHALVFNVRHLNARTFDQYDVWLLEFSALAFCTIAALALLRQSLAPAYEKLALVLCIIEICLVTPTTWSSLDADMRSFMEVYLLGVIILLGVPPGRLGARFAWVLPVVGTWMAPTIAVVVHGKLLSP